MLIIFMFSSIPSESMPTFGRYDLPVKKFGHAAGYALLAGSFAWGLGRYDPKSMGLAWLVTVLYAASDELHQAFVPGRNASLMDIGIDALGALVGLVPAFYLWLRTSRTNNPAVQRLFPKL
jgi:VanZ family protein